jgi:hypothetical protein
MKYSHSDNGNQEMGHADEEHLTGKLYIISKAVQFVQTGNLFYY